MKRHWRGGFLEVFQNVFEVGKQSSYTPVFIPFQTWANQSLLEGVCIQKAYEKKEHYGLEGRDDVGQPCVLHPPHPRPILILLAVQGQSLQTGAP